MSDSPAGSVQVRAYLMGLQTRIVEAMEAADGGHFISDSWEKAAGEPLQGQGITRIIEGGALLERGGCGCSHVLGPKLPPSATQHRPELAGAPFEAMGVSLVFHPRNPYVPTVHMNVRMIAAGHPGQEPTCWFGGGMDLTPYYGFEEDARHFHRTCQAALAPFGDDKYPRFKQWCDQYFFLKHRNEPRGVGGVFFDDFSELGFDDSFAMMAATGDAFLDAYLPIVDRRKSLPAGERERVNDEALPRASLAGQDREPSTKFNADGVNDCESRDTKLNDARPVRGGALRGAHRGRRSTFWRTRSQKGARP